MAQRGEMGVKEGRADELRAEEVGIVRSASKDHSTSTNQVA